LIFLNHTIRRQRLHEKKDYNSTQDSQTYIHPVKQDFFFFFFKQGQNYSPLPTQNGPVLPFNESGPPKAESIKVSAPILLLGAVSFFFFF